MGLSDLYERRDQLLSRARERGDALQRYLVAVNGLAIVAILSIAGDKVHESQNFPGFLTASTALFTISIILAGSVLWRNLRQGSRGLDIYDEVIGNYIDDKNAEEKLEHYRRKCAKPYVRDTERLQKVGFVCFASGMAFILLYLMGVTSGPMC